MRTNIRRKVSLLFVGGLLATTMVWACGSDEDENPNGGAAAGSGQAFYVDKVNASIDSTCAECHKAGKSGAPVFLGANALASYTAIEGFPGLISAPSFSPLVQKGPHSGPALTATQTELVTQWLKLEVTQRKLNADPGTPKNLRAAFKAFGQCMDYARWTELKLNTIGKTTTENNQGVCISCHNTGMASMYFSADPDDTFLKMREFPYIQRLIVGRVNKEGLFDGLEGSRRITLKGTEAQQPQSNSHPRYSLSGELAANIDTFVQETLSNLVANRCQNVTVPEAGPDADPN